MSADQANTPGKSDQHLGPMGMQSIAIKCPGKDSQQTGSHQNKHRSPPVPLVTQKQRHGPHNGNKDRKHDEYAPLTAADVHTPTSEKGRSE
jgi:hypothetical protein